MSKPPTAQFATVQNVIFSIRGSAEFEALAMKVFELQYQHLPVYGEYCRLIGKKPEHISGLGDIPFLPVECFKNHDVMATGFRPEVIFESSGTTGIRKSRHAVKDLSLYRRSLHAAFGEFVGNPSELHLFALLPHRNDRNSSSLLFMADTLMQCNKSQQGGFFGADLRGLTGAIAKCSESGNPTAVIGVSFALLDLAEKFPVEMKDTIVIETGGMKGNREEITREEMYGILYTRLKPRKIISEYGMTELLSQAYSDPEGAFRGPPWMRAFIRDIHDPVSVSRHGAGGLNFIDLANIYSCAFIATSDLGTVHENGTFEVLGRLDHSDLRGCNLLYDSEISNFRN